MSTDGANGISNIFIQNDRFRITSFNLRQFFETYFLYYLENYI